LQRLVAQHLPGFERPGRGQGQQQQRGVQGCGLVRGHVGDWQGLGGKLQRWRRSAQQAGFLAQ